jgi:dienelactone hydrolase
VDPKRLGVIGASIGATATSWFAGTSDARRVRAFVALSPTIFQHRPERYAPKNLLLLADADESPLAKEIAEAARTDPAVETTAVYGHGVSLLDDGKVRATVLRWLNDRMRPS